MSLDMDNAFNAVEWSWIRASLVARGFPRVIVDWFNTLYNESFSRLTYNGHISEPIWLSRSARQGDPISGYLFIIALEYLLDKIRANENIKGIKIGTVEIKLSAYADDILCFLDGSPNSTRQLFAELGSFAKFSGLKPNIGKTSVMGIGINTKPQLCANIPLAVTDTIKLLGITFSNRLNNMTELNYLNKISEIESLINQWRKRQLTIQGKIIVLKSLVLSKLIHLLTALPRPNDETISRLEKVMYRFIWNGKRGRIRKEILALPYASGGQWISGW